MNTVVAQDLNINQYTVHDGLKQMQVNGVDLDDHGNLWVSTRGGLSRFNGAQFDNFDDIPCIPGYVNQTTQDQEGNIWIVGGDRLVKFDGAQCEAYLYPEGIRANQFASIAELESGLFLVWDHQTKYYSFIFDGVGFIDVQEYLGLPDSIEIANIALESDRIFALSKSEELLIFKNKELIYNKNIPNAYNLQVDKTSGRFAFFPGIVVDAQDSFLHYRFDKDFNLIQNCAYDKNNMGHRYQKDAVLHDINHSRITDNYNLYLRSIDRVIPIAEVAEKWNVLWRITKLNDIHAIASDRGLGIIKNELFYQVAEKDYPNIWCVIENGQGDIITGGYGVGLKVLSKEGPKEISLIDESCKVGHEFHPLDQIYFGPSLINKTAYFSSARGILKETPNGYKLLQPNCKKGQKDASLFTQVDLKRNLLIECACSGVNIWDVTKEQIIKQLPKSLLKNKSCVLTTTVDDDGYYWFGYRPHVTKYDPDTEELKFYDWDDDDGINTYMCSAKDSEGTLWFGGRNGMVYYDLDQDSLIRFPLFENLIVSSLYFYAEDKLFASLEDGLAMINIAKYKESGQLEYRIFNQYNGFLGIEPNQNGLYLDSQDRLWITSSTHLSYTYPKQLTYEKYDLKPNIVKINGQRINYQGDIIVIEPGSNKVQIDYEAISQNRPNKVYYSYQVNDEDWSSWTTNTTTLLGDLPSGIHTFFLKVKDEHTMGTAISEAQFSIDIPFYREPNFAWRLGYLSFLLLGTALVIAWRNNDLKKEKELLEVSSQNLALANQSLTEQIASIKNKSTTQNDRDFKNEKLSIRIPAKDAPIEIKISNIVYIQSAKNYIDIHVDGIDRPITYRATLKGFLSKWLPESIFVQIHKSYVVNKLKVNATNGDHLSISYNSKEQNLPVGVSYRAKLQSFD